MQICVLKVLIWHVNDVILIKGFKEEKTTPDCKVYGVRLDRNGKIDRDC